MLYVVGSSSSSSSDIKYPCCGSKFNRRCLIAIIAGPLSPILNSGNRIIGVVTNSWNWLTHATPSLYYHSRNSSNKNIVIIVYDILV